jgi:hypothetical protein
LPAWSAKRLKLKLSSKKVDGNRVLRIGPTTPDRKTFDVEIARLRDLDVGELRNRWQTVFGRRPPPHLPRHLLFRVLAYRLQADHLGDLDGEYRRLLDCSESPEKAGQRAVGLSRHTAELRPGTMLAREWNGQMQRVAVLADGFAWNGETYPSQSRLPSRSRAPAGTGRNSSACETSHRKDVHHEGRISENSSLCHLHPSLD